MTALSISLRKGSSKQAGKGNEKEKVKELLDEEGEGRCGKG